jgi:hypothetical protein
LWTARDHTAPVLTAWGETSDVDLERVHAHGYSDEQIAKVAGLVARCSC